MTPHRGPNRASTEPRRARGPGSLRPEKETSKITLPHPGSLPGIFDPTDSGSQAKSTGARSRFESSDMSQRTSRRIPGSAWSGPTCHLVEFDHLLTHLARGEDPVRVQPEGEEVMSARARKKRSPRPITREAPRSTRRGTYSVAPRAARARAPAGRPAAQTLHQGPGCPARPIGRCEQPLLVAPLAAVTARALATRLARRCAVSRFTPRASSRLSSASRSILATPAAPAPPGDSPARTGVPPATIPAGSSTSPPRVPSAHRSPQRPGGRKVAPPGLPRPASRSSATSSRSPTSSCPLASALRPPATAPEFGSLGLERPGQEVVDRGGQAGRACEHEPGDKPTPEPRRSRRRPPPAQRRSATANAAAQGDHRRQPAEPRRVTPEEPSGTASPVTAERGTPAAAAPRPRPNRSDRKPNQMPSARARIRNPSRWAGDAPSPQRPAEPLARLV